jgi:PKD repeat protein
LGPSIDCSASTAEGPNPLGAQFTPVCDEPIGSYARTFGNGETSDDPSPVRVYRAAGTYTVSLTAGLTGDAGVHEAEDALITVLR